MTAFGLFIAAIALWFDGAVIALLCRQSDRHANYFGNAFAIAGSVLGLVSSSLVLLSGQGFSYTVATSLPLLSLSFSMDRLSAFFVFVISLVALPASVYALGYVKHYYGKYSIGALGFFYNIFLAALVAVVTAHHALFFLLVWEIMSLASYFLVVFENRERENVQAGSLYFIMTHTGTAFITLAFLILYQATGSLDFAVIKDNIGGVSPSAAGLVFILALIGFGTKAGIIPLHIWLPSAHPAAPSHVSALMSGVMIKTGIYMLVRLFMDILPIAPKWWGVVIGVIGAVSSLLGVLYALTEHDIKKLLAYHSIENIGIILLGLGSALMFWSLGMKPLAMLGLAAALFHTLNHALFKALLFLGAGAVISATHTRNIEEYGGLIKLMPQTAFFFLVGSMAISALPPFNGFFSEWLTFQSLFSGIAASDVSVRWVFILGAGSLAFTGGLAAMCFVKAFGATFLARPRSDEVRHAREAGFPLRASMAFLAALTLVVGCAAGPVSAVLSSVVGDLSAFQGTQAAYYSTPATVGLENGFAAISMPLFLAVLVAATALAYLVVSLITKNRKVKVGRTWDCGTTLDSRMEITARGFARSIIAIFSGVLKPTQQMGTEYHDDNMRYFPKARTVRLGIRDIYRGYLYQPVHMVTSRTAARVEQLLSGNVSLYVLFILGALVALLFGMSI